MSKQDNKTKQTTELKDSGSRQKFSSGAVRDAQENKGRFDLIPFWPMLAYASILEAGARKYKPNNWRKGMPIGKYIDSGQRHLEKYKAGFRDEPHLWQAFWNIGSAIHTQVELGFGRYPSEFNDLYSDIVENHDAPVELFSEFERTIIAPYKTITGGPSLEECVYLAAMIDGEGCFSIVSLPPRIKEKRKLHYEARITVYNTKRELMDWINSRFGGFIHTRDRKNNKHAISYYIDWNHKDVDKIIKFIAPYLVIKKSQLDLMVKFRSLVSNLKGGRGGTPKHIIDELESIKQQMHKLNAKGPK